MKVLWINILREAEGVVRLEPPVIEVGTLGAALCDNLFHTMIEPEQIVERRTEIVFPNDANHHGTLFGGKALAMMDIVAGITAMRAFRRTFVTASIDRIDFRAPIKVGEFAETKYLLYNGAHRHVAGVFLGEAYRDGFWQGHVESKARVNPRDKK